MSAYFLKHHRISLSDIVISIYILYPVHGDKNHHKPDIFIGENIDILNGF